MVAGVGATACAAVRVMGGEGIRGDAGGATEETGRLGGMWGVLRRRRGRGDSSRRRVVFGWPEGGMRVFSRRLARCQSDWVCRVTGAI